MKAVLLALVFVALAHAGPTTTTTAPPVPVPGITEEAALRLENVYLRKQSLLERSMRLRTEQGVLETAANQLDAEITAQERAIFQAAGADPAKSAIDLKARMVVPRAPEQGP